jgi:hypothetical protein
MQGEVGGEGGERERIMVARLRCRFFVMIVCIDETKERFRKRERGRKQSGVGGGGGHPFHFDLMTSPR